MRDYWHAPPASDAEALFYLLMVIICLAFFFGLGGYLAERFAWLTDRREAQARRAFFRKIVKALRL